MKIPSQPALEIGRIPDSAAIKPPIGNQLVFALFARWLWQRIQLCSTCPPRCRFGSSQAINVFLLWLSARGARLKPDWETINRARLHDDRFT
jgi:hypothetical protein